MGKTPVQAFRQHSLSPHDLVLPVAPVLTFLFFQLEPHPISGAMRFQLSLIITATTGGFSMTNAERSLKNSIIFVIKRFHLN